MSFIKHRIKVMAFLALGSGIVFTSAQSKVAITKEISKSQSGKVVPTNLNWSERMLLSEMHRFPESWMLDFSSSPKWTYPSAIVLDAAEILYAKTGKKEYCNLPQKPKHLKI